MFCILELKGISLFGCPVHIPLILIMSYHSLVVIQELRRLYPFIQSICHFPVSAVFCLHLPDIFSYTTLQARTDSPFRSSYCRDTKSGSHSTYKSLLIVLHITIGIQNSISHSFYKSYRFFLRYRIYLSSVERIKLTSVFISCSSGYSRLPHFFKRTFCYTLL